MVAVLYISALILAAVSVSVLGAAFSVSGLARLFSGAALAVTLMAASLEFSKFVVAAFLHRTWKQLNFLFRTYLLLSVIVLSVITSMGIFGFLSDASGWQRWLFVILALAVSLTLIIWMGRLRARVHALLACGLALIVGGALGNMIDRIVSGRVVDFIHVHWRQHYFPAFNIADSAITVGALILLLDAWAETRAARSPPVRV